MLGQDPSVGSGHNAQKSTASVSPAPSALVDDGPATAADDAADEYALAGPYTIDPTSWQYLMWKDGLILSAILSIVTLPMLLAFVVKVPGAYDHSETIAGQTIRAVEIAFDIFFGLDIVVSCFLSYTDETGCEVHDHRLIIRRYARTDFPSDLLCVVPFEELSYLHADLRRVIYLRFLRFVRLRRAWKRYTEISKRTDVNFVALSLGRCMFLLVSVIHISACVFWILASENNFSEDTWVGAHVADAVDYELNRQYVTALYWSATTLTTVGYGDISPVSTGERVFGIALMVLNVLFAAIIVGNVTVIFTKADVELADYREAAAHVQRFVDAAHIPEALSKAMFQHLELRFGQQGRMAVLREFPTSVRAQLREFLYGQDIKQQPMFIGCSDIFVQQVISRLEEETFMPGMTIASAHDIMQELILITSGHAGIVMDGTGSAGTGTGGPGSPRQTPPKLADAKHFSEKADDPKLAHLAEHTVTRLGKGDHVGGEALFSQILQPWTVRAVDTVKAVKLSEEDRRDLARDWPECYRIVLLNLINAARASQRHVRQQLEHLDHTPKMARRYSASNPDETESDRHSLHSDASSENGEHKSEVSSIDLSTLESLAHAVGTPNADDANRATSVVGNGLEDKAERRGSVETFTKRRRRSVRPQARRASEDVLHKLKLVCMQKYARCLDEMIARLNGSRQRFDQDIASQLCTCASKGNVVELERLLFAVENADMPDYDFRTALHLAAAEGQDASVRALIEHGADVNAQDRFGTTPLQEAVKAGADKCLEILLEHGAEMNLKSPGELICATAAAPTAENELLMNRLLRAGVPPDSCDYDRRTGLHLAAAEGNLGMVKMLVDSGAAVGFKDRWGVDALIEATKHKHVHVVQYLVDVARADVSVSDKEGHTALYHAVLTGTADSIRVLAAAGAVLGSNAEISEMMCRTGASGDDDMLGRLLSAKADPDAADYDRRTALHLSAAEGKLGSVRLLVDAGATLEFKDRWGVDALIEAVKHDQYEVAKFLVARGASTTAEDNEGKTALQYAMKSANSCLALLNGSTRT